MAINGQIYGISNPKAFFESVLLGQKPSGFVPLSNMPFQLTINGFFKENPFPIPIPLLNFSHSVTVNQSNSSFVFPDFPAAVQSDNVAIQLSLHGHPLYRSSLFSYARARQGNLDIYLNQPASEAITAGELSQHIPGGSLPSDTKLQAHPWGIWLAGDQSGADVQFGISITPDTWLNLDVFADVALDGWNIHVGFPASCSHSASGILDQIKASMGTASSPLNAFIKQKIIGFLTTVAGSFATELYNSISVTFTSIQLPNTHIWPLSDTKDKTPILSIGPTIGYPRKW